MWIYKCDVGEYAENNVLRLFITIISHRFSHFLKGEGFVD
jgi:hypothetical protein